MRQPRPPFRPRPGQSTFRPGEDALNDVIRDVLTPGGAPADIRDRIDELIGPASPDRPDNTPGRVTGPMVDSPSEFKLRPIETDLVLDVVGRLGEQLDLKPRPGQLQKTADVLLGVLREVAEDALPKEPLRAGALGAQLPLPDRIVAPLLRQAASEAANAEAQVLWDDGVNQLLVDIGGIKSETRERRVTISIPVACDQVKTTMLVPFATGGKDRVAGLVTAAPDRPLGDALIAQLWGNALIALAHKSLLSLAEAISAASGRDERNDRLVPRALHAEKGLLRIDTEARRQLKGVVR